MRYVVVFVAIVVVAAPLGAQFLSVPFGGPRKVRPSAAATLRGSAPDLAAAVAARGRPVAMVDLDESRRPRQVLAFLGLPLGARVLDVMAGGGYYSEIVANAVGPGGRVTALVPPLAMRPADERSALSGVIGRAPSVAILSASPAAVALPPGSFDFALVQLVPGNLYYAAAGGRPAAAFLGMLRNALVPGAIVGVVDQRIIPDAGAPVGAGVDPAIVKADFGRAGFVFDGVADVLATPRGASPANATPPAARLVLRFHTPE